MTKRNSTSKYGQLHPDLAACVDHSAVLGTMIRHPLLYELFVSPQSHAMTNERYASKQAQIAHAIAHRDGSHFVWLHERPHRADALLKWYTEHEKIIGSHQAMNYWRLVGQVWIDTESVTASRVHRLWNPPRAIIRHYTRCKEFARLRGSAMSRADRVVHADRFKSSLGKVFLYRGESIKDGTQQRHSMRWSWTTSKRTAVWFASRWGNDGCAQHLLRARVRRCDVIAYFSDRGEHEAIIDPRSIDPLCIVDVTL